MAYGQKGLVTYRGRNGLNGYSVEISAPGMSLDGDVLRFTHADIAHAGYKNLGQLLRKEGWSVDR